MKFFKWLLIFLLTLVFLCWGGLYLARYRPSYARISCFVEIAAPPATVFEYISTPEKARTWIPDMVDVRSLTPGVTGVGAKDQVTMLLDGQKTELVLEVTKFEPGKRLELEEWPVNPEPLDFRAHIVYELEGMAGGGTRITESSVTEYKSEMGRILEPVITHSASTLLDTYLANLKRVVESRSGADTPPAASASPGPAPAPSPSASASPSPR